MPLPRMERGKIKEDQPTFHRDKKQKEMFLSLIVCWERAYDDLPDHSIMYEMEEDFEKM